MPPADAGGSERMAIAYIFPGQGSQSVGMGKDLFDNFAAAREIFEIADERIVGNRTFEVFAALIDARLK